MAAGKMVFYDSFLLKSTDGSIDMDSAVLTWTLHYGYVPSQAHSLWSVSASASELVTANGYDRTARKTTTLAPASWSLANHESTLTPAPLSWLVATGNLVFKYAVAHYLTSDSLVGYIDLDTSGADVTVAPTYTFRLSFPVGLYKIVGA